jgi:hypothetical protein
MEWIESPESSTIARFGYDEDQSLLAVVFKTTGTYYYYDVPRHVFEAMCTAPSKGQFLAQEVKLRYRYARA